MIIALIIISLINMLLLILIFADVKDITTKWDERFDRLEKHIEEVIVIEFKKKRRRFNRNKEE